MRKRDLNEKTPISIEYDQKEKVNGLGMMIGQYLEQNLEEFDVKVRQCRKLNIDTSVEVEKGISTTIKFYGDRIFIQNGVASDTHLHLKSSYAVLAKVLSGTLNPAAGVFSGDIRIIKLPATKPFQALRLLSFLKIPEELLINGGKAKAPILTRERILIFSGGVAFGFSTAYLIFCIGLF
jgi:hypothetical protein